MEDELDLDNRELCPDGNCTGVLGDDGRCKECGRSADGEAPAPTASESADEAFDDDRQLCPDGNCTGLVGADGRCKECRRSATDTVSS